MIATDNLTEPRRRALAVLHAADNGGPVARESNRTDLDRRLVYWQTLRWLDDVGLVTLSLGGRITLTDLGRQVAAEVSA